MILRNRGRPRVPTGRKHSEASNGVPLVAVDMRRNAFYPHLGGNSNGYRENDSPPCDRTTTYTTTLQAYLNCISHQQVGSSTPPPSYYTQPRPPHQPPTIISPPPPPAYSHQAYPPKVGVVEQNGQTNISPRSPRSASAGYGGRRLQRTNACRLIANPYQPTRVANNATPVFSFSPSKKNISMPNVEDSDAQEYPHEYFWYAHQQPAPP